MGGSPDPPDPPDPKETAKAQGQMNKETAIAQARLNMLDEYSPYGEMTYSEIPGTTQDGVTRYRRDIELSPEQQQIMDLQQQLGTGTSQLALDQLGRINEAISQPFDLQGLPEAPGRGDFGESRQRVEDALYGSATRYLDPRFEQEQRQMETQLANMGITRGTEAFQREMDNFNRRKMAQYGDARDRAISAGGQEQSRLFGLASNARERALQELLLQRSQPLNEASALMGTGPGVQMPQFSPPPQTGIQPPDYQGAVQNAYQGELANWQQQQQGQNAMMGSIFGLGGTALGGLAGGSGFQNWLFG